LASLPYCNRKHHSGCSAARALSSFTATFEPSQTWLRMI
jgi:hypothetical protein